MRTVSVACFGLAFLFAQAAWADPNPSSWTLEKVIHGELDAYEGSPGNTVDRIVVGDTSGEMQLTACCSDVDCSRSNTYLITWEITPSAVSITRGETLEVHLTNDLIAGDNCPDIEPYISTCGQEGSPASQITEQGIVLNYPSNSLTYANCDRFYSDPNHGSHVPSPHQVHVYDTVNMPLDGYFWLNITQRWGMQYEVVWVYRSDTAGGGGSNGLADAGMEGGAGGSPSGSSNAGKPASNGQDASASSGDGESGGGGCRMGSPSSGGSALPVLWVLAAILGRRRWRHRLS